MNIRIDLDAFRRAGYSKQQLVQELAALFEKSHDATELMLDRTRKPHTEMGSASIRKDLLAELLSLARKRNIPYEEVIRVATSGSLFARMSNPLIYISRFGHDVPVERNDTSTVTASVYSCWAARRFGKHLGREFSRLRFCLPWPDGDVVDVSADTARTVSRAEAASQSLVAIDSPKTSPLSEFLIARAFNLEPFERADARDLPFEFFFSINAKKDDPRFERPHRAVCRFIEAPRTIDIRDPTTQSSVRWGIGEPEIYRYRWDPVHRSGTDYAVVLVHCVGAEESRAHIVVAGLSGVGTYGATALICDHSDWFDTSPSVAVQAFLVEVDFELVGELRWAESAKMISKWAKTTNRFEAPLPDHRKSCTLQIQ